ncbi:hypothetical protein [Candidatus Neptunochlamydia vexilliferae]|uniref:hypothetical protein n=1 Tax=Candidatus Neptunichlamydia vexilliferae TaxID=1651774 RepID=UPI0018918387|nr:hypothetical protein [Candidatus Neptunochlamydia vexilliferae]
MDADRSLSAQTFKYWEIFLSWLFKYGSRCYEVRGAKDPHIYENPSEGLAQFAESYRKWQASKGIICQVTSSFEDVEKVSAVLKEIYQTVDSSVMCEWAICEVLAKAMAYRNLKEGYEIPLPIMGKDGCMEMATYRVDRVFDLWREVRAFGLIRCDRREGAPTLLFRGTDFSLVSEGGRASIISDLDPKGPGWTLFERGQNEIHQWLSAGQEKGRVMGHSLGGIVAAYTVIHEAPLISQRPHECSYAFNFPGVSEELAKEWDALKEKPLFKGFVCRGDLVSKLGILFGDIYEISLEKPLSPIRAHEMLLFAAARGYLHEVDLEKENSSSSRAFYSKLQSQTSSIIYEFGLKFLFTQ